jgi:hypothetical protein
MTLKAPWLTHFGFCADLRIMPTSGLRTGQPELREAPKTSA